jgi:plasmid stabilization system protein ParE
MLALHWTAFARDDRDNLWSHIAQRSVKVADQYLSGLEVAALRHAANPEMGRYEPELTEKLAESTEASASAAIVSTMLFARMKSELYACCTRGKIETPISGCGRNRAHEGSAGMSLARPF